MEKKDLEYTYYGVRLLSTVGYVDCRRSKGRHSFQPNLQRCIEREDLYIQKKIQKYRLEYTFIQREREKSDGQDVLDTQYSYPPVPYSLTCRQLMQVKIYQLVNYIETK